MSHARFAQAAVLCLSSFVAFLTASCGSLPVAPSSCTSGTIEIWAQVDRGSGLAKSLMSQATTFDSLVVEITGADFDTIRHAVKVDPSRPTLVDTVPSVPAGSSRQIRVYTVNRLGELIHTDTSGTRTVRVDAGAVVPVYTSLAAAAGSIYLQVAGIPTTVDSLHAVFSAGDGRRWGARAKRSAKVNLSVDRIPHQTRGRLTVAGTAPSGDTLYRATAELTFDARTNVAVPLRFTSAPSGLALSLTIERPAATVFTATIGGSDSAVSESGELVITEVMYAANDSEYVELHNPGANDLTFDTLLLEIDGTTRPLANVTVAAGGFAVIGRRVLPWAPIAPSSVSFLDLTSSGSWVSVRAKNRSLIDQVAVVGGSNDLEWPEVAGKRSIELGTGFYSASANNFGRNWQSASAPIEGCAAQFGTPGR